MDRSWWEVYWREVARVFKGRKVCHFRNEFGADRVRFPHGGNSGAGAISLAAHLGARRIVLLGYDCQHAPDGRRHWHGDHPKQLRNAGAVERWPEQFRAVRDRLSGVEIINASRASALDMFPRADLEDVL